MIELPERLTIAEVAAFRQRLAADAGGGPLRIDAARVLEIDTAGLQVLVAAARSRGPLDWQGASDALREAARLIGVETALGLAGAARAQA